MKTKNFVLVAIALAGVTLSSGVMAQENVQPQKRNVHRLDKDYFIPSRFDGKTIFITGGARGIGKWTAIRAAKEGAQVVIMDWLEKDGKEVSDSLNALGYNTMFVWGNIQKTEDCDNAVAQAVKKYGKIDYVCLDAGVMDGVFSGDGFDYKAQKSLLPAIITQATDEYWAHVMATNADGTFKSLRATLNQLLKQNNGGSVVMVGSIAGMTGLSGNPAYVASKWALNGLMRNAAIDYAPYGIRINSVNMAETLTPMVERAQEFVKAEVASGKGFGMGSLKTQSLLKYCDSEKRGAFPWEQASTILYLLSDEASAMTGAVVATDGGWTDF